MTTPTKEDLMIRALVMKVIDQTLSNTEHETPSFELMYECFVDIKEEINEAWNAIEKNDPHLATVFMIQVAAMAIRFILELGVIKDKTILWSEQGA